MGACTSKKNYEPHTDGDGEGDNDSGRHLTTGELRSSRARDSMRFNNRKKESGGLDGNGEAEDSPKNLAKNSRDSMMFNNKNNANSKDLALALVTAEEFIGGCRDVLRSHVLHDKIRGIVEDGVAKYEALDLLCVSMIPRDNMFKFYSQECLKHAFQVTVDGADAIAEDDLDDQPIPSSVILQLLRNMFFIKRMLLCFEDFDLSSNTVSRPTFVEACAQPESLYATGDPGALFDKVASIEGSDAADWRVLVTHIADSFINALALPSV